jgi:hypothetical protein
MKLSQKLTRHSIAIVGLERCAKNNTITLECFIGRDNTNGNVRECEHGK